jgi:MFS family permease
VITIIILVFILKLPPPAKAGLSIRQQVQQLDPLGTIVFLPGIVCLLLALQWGGSTYAWSNGRIIALLILAGILLIAFIAIQFWKKDNATIPPRILNQRSVAAGFFFTICLGSCFMIVVYYLPIWFQAIKGASAVHSGIMNLPLLLSLVTGSILSGILVSKVGYYVPFMFASCLLVSIGSGLLTTLTTTTAHPKWIGFQVVIGFGIGIGMQQASIGAQTVLEKKDVPTGVSIMIFAQSFGGAIFISVAQNVLNNRLIAELSDVPGFNPNAVVDTGATDLRGVIGPKYIGLVVKAYNHALTDAFYIGVGLACTMILGAAFMQWRSVKGKKLH